MEGLGRFSLIQTESCKKLSLLPIARCALFGVLVRILQHGLSIKKKKKTTVIYVREPVLACPAVPHTDSEVGKEMS